jgi:hypothetical protein
MRSIFDLWFCVIFGIGISQSHSLMVSYEYDAEPTSLPLLDSA